MPANSAAEPQSRYQAWAPSFQPPGMPMPEPRRSRDHHRDGDGGDGGPTELGEDFPGLSGIRERHWMTKESIY